MLAKRADDRCDIACLAKRWAVAHVWGAAVQRACVRKVVHNMSYLIQCKNWVVHIEEVAVCRCPDEAQGILAREAICWLHSKAAKLRKDSFSVTILPVIEAATAVVLHALLPNALTSTLRRRRALLMSSVDSLARLEWRANLLASCEAKVAQLTALQCETTVARCCSLAPALCRQHNKTIKWGTWITSLSRISTCGARAPAAEVLIRSMSRLSAMTLTRSAPSTLILSSLVAAKTLVVPYLS